MVRRRRARRALSGRSAQGGAGRARTGGRRSQSRDSRVAKPDGGRDRGAAVLRHEPGEGSGVPLRGHGRGDHERARAGRRDPRRVTDVGLPSAEGGERSVRDRPRAVRGPRPRGQRADVGEPAACHRAAHRCRERLPALVGAVRPRRHRRLRHPGRDRRGRRRGGESPARARLAHRSRSTAGPRTSRPTAAI